MRQVVTSLQAKFRPGFVWIAPWMLENAQFQRCKISCHGSVQSLLPAAENILMQIIFGRYFRGLLRNHATRVTRRVQDFQFFWLQWNPGSGIHLFCIESYCCCCLKDCGQHRVVNRLCSSSPCFRHLWLDSHVNKMDTVKRYKASEINLEGCCGTSRFNWSPLVARASEQHRVQQLVWSQWLRHTSIGFLRLADRRRKPWLRLRFRRWAGPLFGIQFANWNPFWQNETTHATRNNTKWNVLKQTNLTHWRTGF